MSSENNQPLLSAGGIAIIIVTLFFGYVIFVPQIGSGDTHLMPAASNLRSIAGSYQAYTTSGSNSRIYTAKPGDTAHDVAVVLARNNGLNDAALWFIKSDKKLAGQPIPKSVLVGELSDGKIDPNFAKLTLAVEFAANVPANAPPTTTPIAWTRGLRSDGKWDADSPWNGTGGHIAYLDGHVEWVDVKLSTETGGTALVKYGANTPTVNIHEALPPGAVILSAEPNGAQR